MPDITDFDERMRDGHFESKWTGRPKVIITPPPDDTTIGTVSIGGSRDVDEDDVVTYTASNDGDTTKLSYSWSATGGVAVPSGNSCQVTWGSGPTGKVQVSVTSGDATCTDSPQDKTINITVTPTPPPATAIGTMNISGFVNVSENDTASYSVTNDGDAGGLSYKWAIEGGTPTGSTTGTSCEVTWGAAGNGKVTCTITSSDAGATDSPKSKVSNVTIAVVFSLPSIGDVTFSGPQNPTEKTDASYTANNDGDASGLTYFWSVKNGTIKGSNSNKKVDLTCGSAGNMELTCEVNSSDPDVIDAPQTVAHNIPVAMAPAYIGNVTVTGLGQMFLGDEETFTCSFDGNIKSPIYRWKLAGPSGEIITFGGLSDDKVGVRAESPGSFDVICEVDADDWMVEDRGASGKLTVQVLT